MRSITLHCGAHKTGSSLLQDKLKRNSRRLLAAGIRYVPQESLEPLMALLDGRPDPEAEGQIRAYFESMIGEVNSLVVSHESLLGFAGLVAGEASQQFYAKAVSRARLLARCLDGWKIQLILYTRRQDSFLESVYLEGFREEYILGTFQAFFENVDTQQLNWFTLIREIEQAMPKGQITVRPFESISEGSRPFAEKFFKLFVKTDGMDFGGIKSHRRGLSMPAYRLLQGARIRLGGRQTLVRKVLQRAMTNRWLPSAIFLNDRQRADLLFAHRLDNQSLFQEYMPEYPPDFYS